MAGYGITRYVLATGSATSSTVTSPSIWAGDANVISVSIASTAAVATNWIIDGNNADGFLTALSGGVAGAGEWSTITTVTAQGVYSVTPGARWLRVIRPAVNSMATVIFALRST